MKKLLAVMFYLSLYVFVIYAHNVEMSPNSPDYDTWKKNHVQAPEVVAIPTTPSSPFTIINDQEKDDCDLLIPYDASFTLAMEANDDGSTSEIAFPFDFYLYGTLYESFWINNNGNVSFDAAYGTYSAEGFPSEDYVMCAPFWGDVDTRGTGSVWYKLTDHRLVVIWDHVGYYSAQTDKVNTFELILTDGTDSIIGLGNNVAFSYTDMAWTTGSASGGVNGFGGTPANVGVNKGDGVYYSQIGRFDHAGTDYDGPYLNNDGVDWLDCQQMFVFALEEEENNTPPVFVDYPASPVTLTVGDVWVYTVEIISPEASQITDAVIVHDLPSGMSYTVTPGNVCTIDFTVTAAVANIGDWTVTITATDDGIPNMEADYQFDILIDDEELPVELSSFTAVLSAENYVNLTWVTQSETGVQGYYVYRSNSADLLDALVVSPMIDATNTSEQHTYLYSDAEVSESGTYYYWLQNVDFGGNVDFHGPVSVQYVSPGDDPTPEIPLFTELKAIYPNPFNPIAYIPFSIANTANVELNVYNSRGQLLRHFDLGNKAPGYYRITWDGQDSNGSNCGNGVYYFIMNVGKDSFQRKAVLQK